MAESGMARIGPADPGRLPETSRVGGIVDQVEMGVRGNGVGAAFNVCTARG